MQFFQHIILYYFKKGKNATTMQKKICAVCGEGAVIYCTCQKWFAEYCAGDFSLDDAPQSGRLVEVDSDQIEILIESDQRYHVGESRHTQNIQINKVIGENEKCVFYFIENSKWIFLPTQYFSASMNLPILSISYRWNHIICGLWRLAFFI